MALLLGLIVALIVCLATYGLGLYASAIVFWLGRPPLRVSATRPTDAVSVLVPARSEGERALRVITSLLAQDHAGPIEITLLLKDRNDSAIPLFERSYPGADLRGDASIVTLTAEGDRVVQVAFTGVDPKAGKINWIIPRVTTAWVAILDCDHQAHPDWLRTSLVVLHEQRGRIVQARRWPISAAGVFSLWDSLHQHVGCELFNGAFTHLGLTVFFTGTTVVMDTTLLRERPLGACITEDTDLSYELLLSQGLKVLHNPTSGSDEETSPDLYSFLARRRRWANGHTETFLKHLRSLPGSPLGWRDRAQFVFHGSHYLMSVVVFALHVSIGLFFVRQLAPFSQVASGLASLVLAAMIASTQRTIGRVARAEEVAVVFAWLAPSVVIAMNLAQAILLTDLPRASLPIAPAAQVAGIVGLCAPLVLLLVGLVRFGQASAGTVLAVVLTYPLAFYLDITGVLLGMMDYGTGRARWRAVSRAEHPEAAVVADPSALVAPVGIKDSWRLGDWLFSARRWPRRPTMKRRDVVLAAALLSAVFCGGVLYGPASWIPVEDVTCVAQPSDTDPWIVPAKTLKGYCDGSHTPQWGRQTGTFKLLRDDALTSVDTTFWDKLDTTFFCNKAVFSPDNVVPAQGGGLALKLSPQPSQGRDWTSGSIATKDTPDAALTFGRFETVLKPAKVSGVVTGFFLYRFDPWQEIDAEFVGRDTTKMIVNVFYNPGLPGDLYNYGMRGTPVILDLGFDAAADFHRYAIEWEASEIRWFVDGRLVHARPAGRPTPIPQLPMRFHVNVWPCCSEELAGPFVPVDGPMGAELKSVTISRWYPSPQDRIGPWLRSWVSSGDDWRAGATWMQP